MTAEKSRAGFEFSEAVIEDFVREQRLPEKYGTLIRPWLPSLAGDLRVLAENSAEPPRIGVCGAQGSGKSTMTALLTRLLASCGLQVASLSLDDFYLRRDQRRRLAATVHPLLATRGVPGTHDLDLLAATIRDLGATDGAGVSLPRFDKALDDRVESARWSGGRPDLVLLEGWCVGLAPQTAEELREPVNSLEAEEDAGGDWRRFVNDQLRAYDQRIFKPLDKLIFLRAPDFASILRWRGLQERKLRDRVEARPRAQIGADVNARRESKTAAPPRAEAATPAGGIMDEAVLQRFIQHYERLTRHAFATLPDRADWMFVLNESQRIVAKVERFSS